MGTGGDGYEIAATDPNDGVVFYTLSAQRSEHPQLVRRDVCLKCHQGPATLGVPGVFVGSVSKSCGGALSPRFDHHRPSDGVQGPVGRVVCQRQGRRGAGPRERCGARPRRSGGARFPGARNLISLIRKFDPAGYLSPVSDIVALMTFEHQTQMTNLITRVNWEQRMGLRTDGDIESMVEYMLFVDESPIRKPIEGVSTFTQTFPERGPRDRHGRSLRDFDLKTRLFRYPLSFMIYSEQFNSLPAAVKQRIYGRLNEVLSGGDRSDKFANLSEEDRRAILEILRDTKTDWPVHVL